MLKIKNSNKFILLIYSLIFSYNIHEQDKISVTEEYLSEDKHKNSDWFRATSQANTDYH